LAYTGDTIVIKIGYACFFTKLGEWVYRANGDEIVISVDEMAPSQKEEFSDAFAFIANIHNAIGKNAIAEQQAVEQDQFERSLDFGREFARLQKKLNAISRAIGQGFDEEMKSGDDAHDD